MIYKHKDLTPDVAKAAFVAPSGDVIGDVVLGKDSSVWFSVTVRGDMAPIRIGDNTNIQDNCVVHVDTDTPTHIGNDVTVGHSAVVHACTIGDRSLVGMGAIILSNAVIGNECVVGAGALVTENKSFPDRSLIIGSPARSVRTLTDEEVEKLKGSAARYVEKAKATKKSIE
jgi:carbonic anhydrase/acetyltransferase-like protein (isoleucine patch superfamily)